MRRDAEDFPEWLANKQLLLRRAEANFAEVVRAGVGHQTALNGDGLYARITPRPAATDKLVEEARSF